MISPKWSKLAKNWLGNSEGKHCHWCKHIHCEDGEAYCEKEGCEYNDGDRIRTWDGGIAEECKFFQLNEWYTEDKNFEETFNKKEN